MTLRNALDSAFALVAIGLIALIIRREVRPPRTTVAPATPVAEVELLALSAAASSAQSQLAPQREFEVLVLFDVECPFCERFHDTIRAVEAAYRDRIRVGYVHFPLSQHRFARLGARNLECAREQSRFDQQLDVYYLAQDSLGLLSWDDLAIRAGVEDLGRFRECTKRMQLDARLDSNLALGRSIGVRGTPAIVVNGNLLGAPPSRSELSALLDSALAARRLGNAPR